MFVLSELSFDLAQKQLKRNLARLEACYKTGAWPGYKDEGVIEVGVPEHIAQREEQEIFEERDFSEIPFE